MVFMRHTFAFLLHFHLKSNMNILQNAYVWAPRKKKSQAHFRDTQLIK